MSSPTFDASVIADTVERIRAPEPLAAQLIEDLWSEVQRLSAPTYVPSVPMTDADREGPFLGKPEVDVEFHDDQGNACGSSTVGLEMRINQRGLLIISETQVGFTAERPLTVTGYRVWVGGDMIEATVDPMSVPQGATYALELNIPIKLGRDIDHGHGRQDGPSRPPPPTPDKTKVGGTA